jgi:predicted ATPase/DNA-binding winged helix-turn-helix (wHTH) protein
MNGLMLRFRDTIGHRFRVPTYERVAPRRDAATSFVLKSPQTGRYNPSVMVAVPTTSATTEFGRFTLVSQRRELLADGQPVLLGGRAFDTLLALIDARGTVIDKGDLMSRVWPDRVVEEHNLHAQISALRKAFGADRGLIRTVAGRGYQFTAEIRTMAAMAPVGTPSPVTNLPEAVSELIGREADLRGVTELVTNHRLVTLVGAGGIGKTRLGLEVARRLLPRFRDGVFVAELGPLSSPDVVPATVATALGLTVGVSTVSREGIAAAVGAKQLLLVVDNCEHLIQAAAPIVEALLRASPGASLLATSREPLRASGEYIYRVPPLAVPAEDNQDVEDVLSHGAVRLFVARAGAAEPQYAPHHRLAATAAICRHLDGIPLAIELAAARIDGLGVEGVAAHLGDRFMLLTGGNRTALPRHQTMHATLAWSHELLSEIERVVFRRLAVFAGVFTLEAARAVVAGADIAVQDVVDGVASLVTKSLLSADVAGAVVHYRLLETTRAYAREKLVESGELEPFARRHAHYLRDLFARAEAESETRPAAEWLAAYRSQSDNVRAALDWAFSPAGDAAIGVALTATTVPLWMHLALITECRARVEQAIAHLDRGVPADAGRDMRLFLAQGTTAIHGREPGSPKMIVALTKARELAESLDDLEYSLRATWALYIYHCRIGDFRGASTLAEQFRAIAARTADVSDDVIGDRLIGIALHILGDQASARRHIEPLVGADFAIGRRSNILRYQYDQRVVTHCHYAKILWLQGCADQAMRIAEGIVEYARAGDHVLSLLYALVQATCVIAVYCGDLARADRSVQRVGELAVKHGLEGWRLWGQLFEGVLLVKRGESVAGSRLLGAALRAFPEGALYLNRNLFVELAEGLAAAGQVAEGLRVVDDALAWVERTEEAWCLAELLRAKGELLLRQGERAVAADAHAERCLRQALDVARRQDALSWELRTATSLARLRSRQGRIIEARTLLAPVYRRFTEGFGTADLVAAKALLASLRS